MSCFVSRVYHGCLFTSSGQNIYGFLIHPGFVVKQCRRFEMMFVTKFYRFRLFFNFLAHRLSTYQPKVSKRPGSLMERIRKQELLLRDAKAPKTAHSLRVNGRSYLQAIKVVKIKELQLNVALGGVSSHPGVNQTLFDKVT